MKVLSWVIEVCVGAELVMIYVVKVQKHKGVGFICLTGYGFNVL